MIIRGKKKRGHTFWAAESKKAVSARLRTPETSTLIRLRLPDANLMLSVFQNCIVRQKNTLLPAHCSSCRKPVRFQNHTLSYVSGPSRPRFQTFKLVLCAKHVRTLAHADCNSCRRPVRFQNSYTFLRLRFQAFTSSIPSLHLRFSFRTLVNSSCRWFLSRLFTHISPLRSEECKRKHGRECPVMFPILLAVTGKN